MKRGDRLIDCFVSGKPMSKGSWNAMTITKPNSCGRFYDARKKCKVDIRGIAVPVNSSKLKAWERGIGGTIRANYRGPVVDEPVIVHLTFLIKRPKKPMFEYPATSPDIDKLTRAVLDPMTGVVYKDDARIVGLCVYEVYDDAHQGVEIQVYKVEE